MLDLDYGTRAETYESLRRVLQSNTNGKPLSDAHPIEGALHKGDRARNVNSILIDDAPSDSLDNPFDRNFAVDH
jgi:hypothetical protein